MSTNFIIVYFSCVHVVPSNKPSHVLKRRESVTSYQPSPSSNKPRTPAAMETDPAHVPTPRAPTKSNKVVPDPKLRKGVYMCIMMSACFVCIC